MTDRSQESLAGLCPVGEPEITPSETENPMTNELTDYEPETIEGETRDHALATVVAEGDPELMLAHLEKKAELAPRYRQAVETLLVTHTYPEDWTVQDKKACLCSAGAERVGRQFPITFRDATWRKEEFTDSHGKGYRYVYEGYAELHGRVVHVQGSYSTRDKFLGYTSADGWRPVEDINEGHIRNAAYHVFCGNGIKQLLGLRGMPVKEYERIMAATGRDAGKSSTVQRGRGAQGGSTAKGDDKAHQKELGELCIQIADSSMTVEQDDEGNWSLRPLSEGDAREPLDVAKDICIQLSSFTGDKGPVKGKLASKLTGKWLGATLGKARKLAEAL